MPQDPDPLDVIDRFLMSDRAPENSMGLSDLDGFLTGIVVGPDLIMPSEWLPVIWGNDRPQFKNVEEAQNVMSAVMARYNEIIRGFQQSPPCFDPVFMETDDGLVIAADWAEGFNDAIKLRPRFWKPLFDDRKLSNLLQPVMILCGSESHRNQVTETAMMAQATHELTNSIIGIHAYWRDRKEKATTSQ